MCSANVVEVAVFNRSDVLPTAAEVVERLAVGSVPPSTFDTGTYTRCTSAACLTAAPDVVVYLHAAASPPGSLDQRAIFQVRVNGTTMYLLNKESILSLGNFSFHNHPSSYHGSSLRRATQSTRRVRSSTISSTTPTRLPSSCTASSSGW
jgi:hypothetical protein